MNMTMPHLIAEQVRGRVQFCHHGSECVPEIMIFKVDPELLLNFAGWIFERIDRLNFAIWQTVHKFRRRNQITVQIFDEPLVLLAEGCELRCIFFSLGQ